MNYKSLGHSDASQNESPAKAACLEHDQLPVHNGAEIVDSRTPLFGSCRLVLSLVSCMSFVTLYTQRVSLNFAMVCMVNNSAVMEMRVLKYNGSLPDTYHRSCTGHGDNRTTRSGEDSEAEFAWPKEVQGLLLGSFALGSVTSPLIAGWLSEKFGGKRVFGWSMLMCIAVTLSTPVAARADYKALLALRVLAGVCQGVMWPAMTVIWAHWAPPLERQLLSGLCYSGSSIGTVLAFPVAAFLCDYGFNGGWPSVFYCLGLAGLVVLLAWIFLIYDLPEEHPRISQAEKDYICSSLRGNILMSFKKRQPTPWKQLMMSPKVWAYVVVSTCSNWGVYTFTTNIPSYMRDVLHFNYQKIGLASALPFIGLSLVTNISVSIFDAVLSNELCSRTMARKIGNTIGFLIPGLLVIAVGFMDCGSPAGAVVLLTGCVSLTGFQFGAGFLTNPADIAPQHTGVIFGLAKTISTLSGIIAPIMIGFITTDQLQSQWQDVFFIAAGFLISGALIFIVFGSGEIQEWACVSTHDTPIYETSSINTVMSTIEAPNVETNGYIKTYN